MNRYLSLLTVLTVLIFSSCNKFDQYWQKHPQGNHEDPASFAEIGSIDIGEAGAAEISAFDPQTKRLFVVNNAGINKIDVIDFSNPAAMVVIHSIDLAKYNGAVNSVDVHDGMLAAAIESADRQDNGVVAVFNSTTYAEIKVIPVGALPDMITFSPDGKYILTANEGEPNADYTNDPEGTVSIIDVKDNFNVVNLNFSSFAGQAGQLESKGLRVFGPGASFEQDMEPEYVTVSKNSKTAWVTLQENNAIAKIDLISKSVTGLFPLGFKNYSISINGIDPSDKDNQVGTFRGVPVFGMYQPDAIAVLEKNGVPFLFTANEGDVREYDGFEEAVRLDDIILNSTVFPDFADLQLEQNLGRLNITTTLGDDGNNNEFERLYSFGSRSFSVWDGNDGKLLYDSKNNLEKEVVAAGMYDDARSDDKGVEPEGITIGEIKNVPFAFVGMERADAVAIYEIADPLHPHFVKILSTGDAPEGVLFISEKESPVNRSLLVVSSENDGVIKVYAPVN